MNRREFIASGAAFAAAPTLKAAPVEGRDYAAIQAEINAVSRANYEAYRAAFEPAMLERFAALRRLEDAFDRIVAEVKATEVIDKPAVWYLYNMGIIVKTPQCVFSVDVSHRRGHELEPLLDFALITHNHSDHYTQAFYMAMNGAHKTVINNFADNYGTRNWKVDGGYTRVPKTFKIKDVEIKTNLTDHNNYLIDFTTVFEISVNGYTIYHSGDCGNVGKLNPTRRPDLWLVHPFSQMKTEDGVRKFNPVRTAVMHLNEMGHDVNKWRFTWNEGLEVAKRAREAGGEAFVPVWGERLV